MCMLRRYLDRIGIDPAIADAMVAGDRGPSEDDLGLLLRAHLLAVPFENLSQHAHPGDTTVGIPAVPVDGESLPTLDVDTTLHKIVDDRRGGFCWEINTAFGWLLERLGYKVRYGIGKVDFDRPVPGHLCLYVEGLAKGHALHVDPGFGDAPRTPIPAVLDRVVVDPMLGDEYCFVANDKPNQPSNNKRFDAVLMRRRAAAGNSPMPDLLGSSAPEPETPCECEPPGFRPVCLLGLGDDFDKDCDEFRDGLAHTLIDAPSNLFARKRFCLILREKGFEYVGSGYRKEVRDGKEVSREVIESEAAYRDALEMVAGIRLG